MTSYAGAGVASAPFDAASTLDAASTFDSASTFDTASTFDSTGLRAWIDRAHESLVDARERLDALNVFPVPDSDTGTNLVLTLAEGREAVSSMPAEAALGELAQSLADGVLVAARGNSGIILSQYLRAIGEVFADQADVDGGLWALALDRGALMATSAIAEPVEGTALTVIDAAADAARGAAYRARGGSIPVGDVALAAVAAAREALLRTPTLLAPLAERGVVDAGGAGFVLLLQALADVVTGSRAEVPLQLEVEPSAIDAGAPGRCATAGHGSPEDLAHWQSGAFEVMYVLRATLEDAEMLQTALGRIGASVGVVGGLTPGRMSGLWHVHVHTDDPVAAVTAARGAPLRQVCVRYLRGPAAPSDDIGVVACTQAPGLLAPLAEAGAVVVLVDPRNLAGVRAGIARAVVDCGRPAVVVLPCDAVSTEAARATAQRARTPDVEVLGCADEAAVVAGVAALGEAGGSAADRLRAAVDRTRTAVVGRPAVGADLTAAAADAARALVRPGDEILTAVVGDGVPRAALDALAEAARLVSPGIEVLEVDGGQAAPALSLGVE